MWPQGEKAVCLSGLNVNIVAISNIELIFKKTKTKRYDGVTRNVIGVYGKRKKMFPKYIRAV